MNRLKAALQREYEDDPNTTMQIHNPRNTHSVELYFRGEKTAKVMGQLAVDQPEPGKTLSGILVKRNFNYHILSPDDLSSKLFLTKNNTDQVLAVKTHSFSVINLIIPVKLGG